MSMNYKARKVLEAKLDKDVTRLENLEAATAAEICGQTPENSAREISALKGSIKKQNTVLFRGQYSKAQLVILDRRDALWAKLDAERANR